MKRILPHTVEMFTHLRQRAEYFVSFAVDCQFTSGSVMLFARGTLNVAIGPLLAERAIDTPP